ncbi:MAG: hypothetical protein J2P46_12815 [Zavarzinella sp.]|nr:hypothetical protein [Zavarzinella sp.]
MKGVWLVLLAGALASVGCKSTPKREMRQPAAEEFAIPPSNMYTTPPDVPRDQPVLTPKNSGGPGAGPAMPGPTVGGPGMTSTSTGGARH